jgi:membrane peptidoglycan carboxypeptidase
MAGTVTAQRPGARAVVPRRSRRVRWIRRILGLAVTLLVLVALLLGAAWALTPSVGDAPRRVAAFLAAHDAPALQGAVPARLSEALIATEDSRFRSNPGIDPISLLRAPVALVSGGDAGGATLEQQLAKNLYENGANAGGTEKAAEAVLALKLDSNFSKDEILRLYLDDGYYGHGFYGLTAATRGYFGVDPAQLTEAQASLLAGLFQAPSAYDPVLHPDAARARQAHVLDRLVAVGALTRAQATAVGRQPWGLRTG